MHSPTDAQSIIDLRSDTVTVPTRAMIEAMMAAEVGDDVYGEDTTVNRLEARVAEMLGMEAGLFVASGTMGNLVCICAHTRPGDEMILDDNSHCYYYEGGGYAAVAGVGVRFVHTADGVVQPEQIRPLVQPDNAHFARSRLVVIENTHNRGGGTPYPLAAVRGIAEVCRDAGLRLHMDGARLWDACVATGAEPADYAAHADSVTVCLSKGLGCPVGSVVAGSAEFIERARRVRKRLGGGLRQAGYMAAAGLYAIENNIARLAEDHAHARLLADGLRPCAGLRLVHDPPPTNMVYIDVVQPPTADDFRRVTTAAGILIGNMGGTVFRAVPHLGISRTDIEQVIEVLAAAFR